MSNFNKILKNGPNEKITYEKFITTVYIYIYIYIY